MYVWIYIYMYIYEYIYMYVCVYIYMYTRWAAADVWAVALSREASSLSLGTHFACFTGTKVQILKHIHIRRRRLLYWYKSTHTDAFTYV